MKKYPLSIIGKACDTVPGALKRTVAGVAGRTLEECIELCLAAGLTVGQIQEHVNDSIYNQYLKVSAKRECTVFPSQPLASDELGDLGDEIADVVIMLSDLLHVSKDTRSLDYLAQVKLQKFLNYVEAGEMHTNAKGLCYRRKAHIK